MTKNIQDLHQQAEKLREQDKLLKALKLYEEVILGYQSVSDYAGICEALGGRCLTYKHLFLLTKDFVFAYLAKGDAQSSKEIALRYQLKNKQHRTYFRLGEISMLFKDYPQAIENYQQALDSYPRDEAEKGDFQYHLGEAQYKAGLKTEGKKNLLEGVEKIKQFESSTDSFVYHVWLSGGYMRLAEALWHDSPSEAKEALSWAEEIVNSDDRLIIRKRQLSEMKQELTK